MKTATTRRGKKMLGTIFLPALALTLFSFLGISQAIAMPQNGGEKIEDLLPAETLVFVCTEDMKLARDNEDSMPLFKILKEDEVVEFLKKPKEFLWNMFNQLKEMAAEEETLKNADLNIEKFLDADVGRFFFALTNLTLPEEGTPNPMGLIPDIGLLVGAEFRNPDENVIQFLKTTAVSLANAKGVPIRLVKAEYNGATYEKMMLPLPMPVLVPCFGKVGAMDVFTTSETALKAMLDREAGRRQDCLSKNSDFIAGTKYIDFSDPASTKSYFNPRDLIKGIEAIVVRVLNFQAQVLELTQKQFAEEAGESFHPSDWKTTFLKEFPAKLTQLIDLTGLMSIQGVYGMQLSKGGLARSVTYTAVDGPEKGLLALCPARPITPDKLRMIPKNSVAFTMGNFDTAALYDLIMEGIKMVDSNVYAEVQGGIDGFFRQLAEGGEAIDLRRDILGSLGTELIYYELKPKGMAMMMAVPPSYFFIEAKDYDRFVGAVEKLFEGLKTMVPEVGAYIALKSVTYEGCDIRFLQFQGVPIPIQPCFAKVDKYLVVSFQSNDLKSLIKTYGKSETSILDNEDFKKHYGNLPKGKEMLSLGYSNIPVKFGSAYEQLSSGIQMLPMFLPDIDLPIDFTLLPTPECITKHLFSSVHASYKEGNGYKRVNYGPIGAELTRVLVPALAGAGAAAILYATPMKKEMESAVSEEVIVTEETVDPALKAKRDLGALAGGCLVYYVEHGNYPESLDELLVPTAAYPDGFYPAKSLPVDPWNKSYNYKKATDGKRKYMIWSCGPNGICEEGGGDDIVKIK